LVTYLSWYKFDTTAARRDAGILPTPLDMSIAIDKLNGMGRISISGVRNPPPILNFGFDKTAVIIDWFGIQILDTRFYHHPARKDHQWLWVSEWHREIGITLPLIGIANCMIGSGFCAAMLLSFHWYRHSKKVRSRGFTVEPST
jgi:hypothetical protein